MSKINSNKKTMETESRITKEGYKFVFRILEHSLKESKKINSRIYHENDVCKVEEFKIFT